MQNISTYNFTGKRAIVRVDFNVPLHHGKVMDELRIEAAIPTIKYLIEQKAKIILASHLGRPDGKPVEEFSLEPVAILLSKLLNREVLFLHDCVGESVQATDDAHRSHVELGTLHGPLPHEAGDVVLLGGHGWNISYW